MNSRFTPFLRPFLSADSWQAQVPAYALGLFRIWFGILMAWEMLYFIRIDFVEIFISMPMVQMSYTGLSWLKPLPDVMMWGLIYLLLATTILIILGKWFRWAMLFFAIGFTYIFLLDQAYYNNHLYLLSILSFWMATMPLDAALAVGKKEASTAPAASYAILRFHIVMVYFFGGIAKLNPDWLLRQQPVQELMVSTPFLSNLLGEDLAVYFLTYGGVVFDLVIGFFLLYKPLRSLGFAGAILFNGLNAIVFDDINIFPFFMLGTLVLFLEPETVAAWFKNTSPKKDKKASKATPTATKLWGKDKLLQQVFIAYVVFQCVWPFRHLVIPGEVEWTGQGQLFSWRMKIQHRSIKQMEFMVMDYRSRQLIPVDLDAYHINYDQRNAMARNPQLIMTMVDFLANRAKSKQGHEEIGVQAKISVAFNGRSPQWITDPEKDLTKEEYHAWGRNDWILPLAE